MRSISAFHAHRLPVLLILFAAACARNGGRTDTAASPGAVIPDSAAPAAAAAPPAAGAPVALTIAADPAAGGVILTDAQGRAVYFLESPDGKAVVECTGECATAFDPVTGQAIVATGDTTVQVALISQITRPDGSTQVTYGGKPLFYHRGDQSPSDRKGSGMRITGGQARLITPQGKRAGPGGAGGASETMRDTGRTGG